VATKSSISVTHRGSNLIVDNKQPNMDHLERSIFSGLLIMFIGFVMTETIHSLPNPEMFYLFLFFAGFLAALFGCF
jgi:hypothetical protein